MLKISTTTNTEDKFLSFHAFVTAASKNETGNYILILLYDLFPIPVSFVSPLLDLPYFPRNRHPRSQNSIATTR